MVLTLLALRPHFENQGLWAGTPTSGQGRCWRGAPDSQVQVPSPGWVRARKRVTNREVRLGVERPCLWGLPIPSLCDSESASKQVGLTAARVQGHSSQDQRQQVSWRPEMTFSPGPNLLSFLQPILPCPFGLCLSCLPCEEGAWCTRFPPKSLLCLAGVSQVAFPKENSVEPHLSFEKCALWSDKYGNVFKI